MRLLALPLPLRRCTSIELSQADAGAGAGAAAHTTTLTFEADDATRPHLVSAYEAAASDGLSVEWPSREAGQGGDVLDDALDSHSVG